VLAAVADTETLQVTLTDVALADRIVTLQLVAGEGESGVSIDISVLEEGETVGTADLQAALGCSGAITGTASLTDPDGATHSLDISEDLGDGLRFGATDYLPEQGGLVWQGSIDGWKGTLITQDASELVVSEDALPTAQWPAIAAGSLNGEDWELDVEVLIAP